MKTQRKIKPKSFSLIWPMLLFLSIVSCQKGPREDDSFQIVAHRGASAYAPENTRIAIQTAVEKEADCAELDVRMTRDGRLVLMHDDSLERSTGRQGLVWDFRFEELKNLEAGAWFSPEFEGEPIPTLEEIIDLARGSIKLNIEIKTSRWQLQSPELIARKVADLLHRKNFTGQAIVTSFDRTVVDEIEYYAPKIRTGLIFEKEYPETVFDGPWDALSVFHETVDEEFVRKTKLGGKKLYVWTVNEEEPIRKMLALGVDGIISDKPDLVRRILEETPKKNNNRRN